VNKYKSIGRQNGKAGMEKEGHTSQAFVHVVRHLNVSYLELLCECHLLRQSRGGVRKRSGKGCEVESKVYPRRQLRLTIRRLEGSWCRSQRRSKSNLISTWTGMVHLFTCQVSIALAVNCYFVDLGKCEE
jgi:hypothetical protein